MRQGEDSFAHLLECTGLEIPFLQNFLVLLAQKAVGDTPGYPEPIRTIKMGELEIELPPSPIRSEGEISLGD